MEIALRFHRRPCIWKDRKSVCQPHINDNDDSTVVLSRLDGVLARLTPQSCMRPVFLLPTSCGPLYLTWEPTWMEAISRVVVMRYCHIDLEKWVNAKDDRPAMHWWLCTLDRMEGLHYASLNLLVLPVWPRNSNGLQSLHERQPRHRPTFRPCWAVLSNQRRFLLHDHHRTPRSSEDQGFCP